MEELIELVLVLNKEIKKEIPLINSGGCGVFTLLMYKQLEKLGYKPNIAIMTSDKELNINSKKEVLNNIINKQPISDGSKESTSFSHCCIEVGGLLFDGVSIGQSLKERWKRYPITGEYTVEELELSLKVGSWNDTYNRREKNPTLRKVIRKAVKQVFHERKFEFPLEQNKNQINYSF